MSKSGVCVYQRDNDKRWVIDVWSGEDEDVRFSVISDEPPDLDVTIAGDNLVMSTKCTYLE